VASIRLRKPGVWEIRVFTGRDDAGRPTQVSKTVRGTKRDAQRMAATLESRPPSNAGGRTVADVLAAWREVNDPVWAETSRRDYASRIARVLDDPIASMNVARLGVADVERWHARLRQAGVGEARSAGVTRHCGQRWRRRFAGVGLGSMSRVSRGCANRNARPVKR